MKNTFGFIVLLLGVNCFSQALNTLNVPTGHPRLFWSPSNLQVAQNWYSSNTFSVTQQNTLSIYDGDDAMDLALKYVLTEGIEDSLTRNDYARRAIEWAKLAIIEVENEQFDSLSNAGTCDACRWYTERIFLIVDWCFNEVYASEWDSIYTSFNQLIPMWNNASWGNPTMVVSNYNHGYARQSIEWAFLIYHENPSLALDLLDNAINLRWENFKDYAQNDGVGGVPSEGTSYAYSMLTYHLYSGMSMKNAGYDYLDETEFFKRAIAHTIYNATPVKSKIGPQETNSFYLPYAYGDAAAFANCNVWDEPLDGGHSAFMLMYAYFLQGIGDLPLYAKGWMTKYNRYSTYTAPPLFVRSITDQLPEKDIFENPLDYFSPEGGELSYGYTKSSWDDPDLVSAFVQMGKPPYTGHEHMDAGNYTITKGDRFLIVPPAGRGFGSGWKVPDYNGLPSSGVDVHNSIAKNTILFGEEGSVFQGKSTGNVDRMQSNEDYFYVVNNLTEAYKSSIYPGNPNYNNVQCKEFTREFIFLRDMGVSLIFDRTQSETGTDQTKTSLVHTQNEPVLTDLNEYTVTNGNYQAVINVLLPINSTQSVIDESSVTGYSPRSDNAHRIQIENTETGVVYFLNVIHAKKTTEDAVNILFNETDSTFVVYIQHPVEGYAMVEFEKGITSTKGRIGFSSSGLPTTFNHLPEGAQEIVVTNDGPEWIGDEFSGVVEGQLSRPENDCGISIFDANGQLYVSSDNSSVKQVDVSIYKISGELVDKRSLTAQDGEFEVSYKSLTSGMYIIRYETDNCAGSKKLIKR